MITWRDQMSIDDGGVIDQDHKHLISIINKFEELAADGLDEDDAAQILYTLKFYTETHFGREEQLQHLIDFPYADAHHKEHGDLIKSLDIVIKDLKNSDGQQKEKIHIEIAAMLHEWLVHHILQSDLKMEGYVEAMKKHVPQFGALQDLEIHPS